MRSLPLPGGVWSATPTPLHPEGSIDDASVRRLVAHHRGLGVAGLFLGGTCGEGPWLRDRERERLTRLTVEASAGDLVVAVQATDNSAGRVLDRVERIAAWGADLAVVDVPDRMMNATPHRVVRHFVEIARGSALPIGLYDRGRHAAIGVPVERLAEVVAEPNVVLVKDSSGDPARRDAYVAARARRPGLVLLNGDEFDCVAYLAAGYDGLLLGGGIFNAPLAHRIVAAVRAGDLATAEAEQARMNELMYRVYGGPKITCWLTGLKELLVRLGVFTSRHNLLDYPLTAECREQIEALVSGADGPGLAAELRRRG